MVVQGHVNGCIVEQGCRQHTILPETAGNGELHRSLPISLNHCKRVNMETTDDGNLLLWQMVAVL